MGTVCGGPGGVLRRLRRTVVVAAAGAFERLTGVSYRSFSSVAPPPRPRAAPALEQTAEEQGLLQLPLLSAVWVVDVLLGVDLLVKPQQEPL